MAATREDLVRIARDVVARTMDKHEYHGNPVTFDPHEWVLEAMRAAYDVAYTLGHNDGERFRQLQIDEDRARGVR